MAPDSTHWLVLAILFLATCDGATVHYVIPSSSDQATNTTCPIASQHCLTLNDYTKGKDQYFENGASLIFLPGMHRLDHQLRLENISNVSFFVTHDGPVRLVLSPAVNITWIDCDNITMTGLEFFLSGHAKFEALFSSLMFRRTTSSLSGMKFFGKGSLQSTAIRTHSSLVSLRDVVVSGATSIYGAALVAFNSTITFAGENYFVNNTATQGGAFFISQSTAVFNGNVSFENNTAATTSITPSALAGAVLCASSILSFHGSVLFQGNKAFSLYGGLGGGIVAQSNSLLTFEASSSVVFTENSATFLGGAIVISGSRLEVLGNALFDSNYARYGGGALRGGPSSMISFNSSSEEN